MLNTLAQAVLAAASAAAPAVTRTYRAGGPQAAKVCEQIIVTPGVVQIEGPGRIGSNVPGLSCAALAKPAVVLAYTKDCYPVVDQPGGGAPQLPDPADIDAWTADYLATCWAIINAVLDAHQAGDFGDCTVVTVGTVTWSGPTAGTATMSIPVSSDGT